MRTRNTKAEFVALLLFMVVVTLVLTNAFVGPILAQEDARLHKKLEPIGDVVDKILKNYVTEPDIDKVVEGALMGMMQSLDEHSAYLPPKSYQDMKDETQGEFEGIGVEIRLDEANRIVVYQPIPDSPAAKAGIHAGDVIIRIDGLSAEGLTLSDAADRIRGPRGTPVQVAVLRRHDNGEEETLEFTIKRGKIPVASLREFWVLEGGIGYIRLSDFKQNTAKEIAKKLKELEEEGMKSLVLDLRWNNGGLLNASRDVCELFLPKDKLVTYTEVRRTDGGNASDEMRLYTENAPVLPESFPIVILTNEFTASAAEIVTGAMQFWKRAIVVGQETYGKGSVQKVFPLQNPRLSALRMTTSLYFTPAEVNIENEGIKPDVEVVMDKKHQVDLLRQMFISYEKDPACRHKQNHGAVTGNEKTEATVEDVQLQRAVEILSEEAVFENLLAKYHKPISETQVEAHEDAQEEPGQPGGPDVPEIMEEEE